MCAKLLHVLMKAKNNSVLLKTFYGKKMDSKLKQINNGKQFATTTRTNYTKAKNPWLCEFFKFVIFRGNFASTSKF